MVRGKPAKTPGGWLVGYARVSTEDQSLEMQIEALKRAGVGEDQIFVETGSGASIKKRKRLRLALMHLEEGDTLVVWKLDRLTRFMPDLYWILDELRRKGASLRSLTEHIDTTTASGRLGMNMATSFAQYERETIAERTKAGLAVIREMRGKGWSWGPRQKLTEKKIVEIGKRLNKGEGGPKLAKRYKVSTATIYRFWRLDRDKGRFVRRPETKPK